MQNKRRFYADEGINVTHTIRPLNFVLAMALAISALSVAGLSPAVATTVPVVCTRYVAAGSPAGDGTTAASPMSLPALLNYVNADSRPGLVACLGAGSYGSSDAEFSIRKGGDLGKPVALVRNPTATGAAVIAGRVVISRGADNVMISKLNFIGPGPGAPSAYSIDANQVELVGNDFSSPNRICISVGGGIRSVSPTLPKVTGFVADGNKVHDCGTALPKTGSPQAHAFYLEYSSGAIIRNNIVRNPVGRGVQLFNDADGSLIENNIFDGNFAAVNFGGGTGGSSSVDPRSENNIVQNNIVTNGIRWCNVDERCQKALFVQGNHEAAYAGSQDPLTKAGATWGNIVRLNCVYFPDPAIAVTHNDWEPGFDYQTSNREVDPLYNNSPAGDFRLKPTSPCLGKGARPFVRQTSRVVGATSVQGKATIRSPWMTASYRLQMRLCPTTVTSVASTAICSGTWSASPIASTIGSDVRVSRVVSNLLRNRIYEYRWLTWQSLLPAPSTGANYDSSSAYWRASPRKKIRTLP